MRPLIRPVLIAGILAGLFVATGVAAQRRGARDVATWLDNNRLLLLGYTWKVRTEFEIDGERAIVRVDRVRYQPGGELLRTELESSTGSDERGFLARRRSKKKRARVEQQEEALRRLIDSYAHMSPEAVRDAFSRAFVDEVSVGSEHRTRVQVRDIVHRGDSMNLWLDGDRLPVRLEVFSALDGEPVRMSGDYERLENGPSYLARSVIETEQGEKKLVIRRESFDLAPVGE